MKTKPVVSLILCTYQRTEELDALFRSLVAQTYQCFEVIVVDQNPDDRILPYLRRAEDAGLTIIHIKHDVPNLSTARNIGIQVAKGEWVGFPDDDCWYEPDLLEQLKTSFACTNALTGCAARWEEMDEADDLPIEITWQRSSIFRDRMMVSFMLFFNRKLFNAVGNFDSRLGVGQWFGAGEETDLVLRALCAGASMTFYPAARVHHPVKKLIRLNDVRQRARGAGALYIKHNLSSWVVLRGLIAPVVRPLVKRTGFREILIGWAYTLGRWEGMLRWKRVCRHASQHSKLAMQVAATVQETNSPMPDPLQHQVQAKEKQSGAIIESM